MKTAIIGRGSVGSSTAYCLKGRGNVFFAVGEDRKDRCSLPIVFNGEKLPVPTLLSGEVEEKPELVIVAVKNFQLHSALPVIEPLLGKETVILPILNGIEAEEVLSLEFGEERVLYGFISGLSVFRDNNVITSFSRGKITFGEKDNSRSERVEAILEYFLSCGQDAVIPEDIHHEKWLKFMTNTCFNTLTAILEADYDATSDNSDMIRAARLVAREVQAIGAKKGVVLDQDDVERMISNTCALKGKGRSSMLEDLMENRETENRYFAGAISRMGKQYDVPTPFCHMLSILLEAKRHVRRCR